MKRRYLMLSPLLLILICSPALAHEHEHETKQVLVTVDPNLFAPGQNISNATYGATLRSVTFIANPNPNAPPEQAFVPQYSPVFAEAVTPNCSLGGPPPLPCAPIGNSVLSYVSNLDPVSFPDFWGPVRPAIGCFDPTQVFCFATIPLLRVDFPVPTDSVSVILANHGVSDGDLEAFTALAAFDETGTNIASCAYSGPS